MLSRQSGSQRRDRICEPRLMHRDDVGVAFDHDRLSRSHDRVLRTIDRVEVARLVKHRGLLGVQVLGLFVAKYPAAEPDHPSRDVAYREHDALVEPVFEVPITPECQIRVDHLFCRETFRLQMGGQSSSARRVTQFEALRDLDSEAALLEVLTRLRRASVSRGDERLVVETSRFVARRPQPLASSARHAVACLGYLDVRSIGEQSDRVGELEMFGLHQKAEHVAAFATSEAVPQLRRRIDLERWCLLLMERTQTPVQSALLLEHD